MITLKRIKLINWHNFVNDCIDIENISYIIGLSGVGKTTIMDAVRYCLTTNKNFNSIGNKNSSRTLQGSVHGKQHTGGYSRPDHTVSYIGCEFLDTTIGKCFIICVRIDSESPYKDLSSVDQDWYISTLGIVLEDIPFFDENTNTPSEKSRFRLPDNGLKLCSSQKDARNRICTILGIGKDKIADKFLSVFHMGTSLDGLSDIREFIYAYILPEPEINPNALDQDRQKLEKMQDVLNSSILKKDLLEDIKRAFETAFDKKSDVDTNEGYICIAEFKGKEEEIELCDREINDNTLKINNCDLRLAELNDKKSETQRLLIEAEIEKDSSDESKALNYFLNKEKELKKNLDTEHKNNEIFNEALDKLNHVCKKISDFEINIPGYPFVHFETSETYTHAKNILLNCEETLRNTHLTCSYESKRISERLGELNLKIEALSKGKFIYPNNNQAECVKELINTALTDAGMKADAKIFCELLQMNDEKWQKAAEVSLNRRRFDIIVSKEHYKIAKSVMLQNKEFCRGISLVDTPALVADEDKISLPEENMLAYKINSENRYAKLYLNTLLHGIYCCETPDDIEKYQKSITPDCIRHMFYRTEFVNGTDLYIGVSARKSQLKEAQKEKTTLKEKEKEYLTKSGQIRSTINDYNDAMHGNMFSDLCSFYGSKAKFEKTSIEYDEVCSKISELKDNPILQALFDLVQKYNDEMSEIDNEIGKINQDIGVSNNAIETSENKKLKLQQESLAAEEAFDRFCEEFPLLIDTVYAKYNENIKTKSAREIVKNQSVYNSQLKKALDKVIDETLIPLQRQYNSTYSTDFAEGMDSFSDFDNLYKTLINIELEKNSESLRNAKERCRERFSNEILFRLKDDIKNAQKQFKRLNSILSQFNYGEESYYFEMNRTIDSELGVFYDVIMSENNAEVDLFNINEIDTETYDIQIQELMNKIMADINEASKSRLAGEKFNEKAWSKYADYRTYLDYDIRITNTVTGSTSYLSEVSGEGSGGETQAPFYVAICASLLQIYNQSTNSIRLVLLDEAFSHMTSDRIRPIIKMFKEMQLQVMLISTAEKCTEIQPFCDTVHSVVRKGSRNAILTFTKEDNKVGIH